MTAGAREKHKKSQRRTIEAPRTRGREQRRTRFLRVWAPGAHSHNGRACFPYDL